MPKENNKFNVDELLGDLFSEVSLNKLFEDRIKELKMTPTHALEILGIEYRALQGTLNGNTPRVDMRNFIKLSSFLKVSKEEVIRLYYKALQDNFPEVKENSAKKRDFIDANFDLACLRRIGFIESISDYAEIENKINRHFGLKTIFEYKLPNQEIAFSSGVRKVKNIFSKGFWLRSAIDAFEKFNNPYQYKKSRLMEYFPEIRWQSTDVANGLTNVISDLYRLGVTVIYQSPIPSLHLKGATMIVNDKPCVVFTNYQGFYSTLWLTLCHELSHVLFDLEEIKRFKYHLSDDNDELPVQDKEAAADRFASEFLLSGEKLEQVKPHINNRRFIKEFASRHQIHDSFIYSFYAFHYDKTNPKAWVKAKTFNPSFEGFISKVENPWDRSQSIEQHVEELKNSNIYN
jgi:HTH-type transcriptional regulator/antitoxin HigA